MCLKLNCPGVPDPRALLYIQQSCFTPLHSVSIDLVCRLLLEKKHTVRQTARHTHTRAARTSSPYTNYHCTHSPTATESQTHTRHFNKTFIHTHTRTLTVTNSPSLS